MHEQAVSYRRVAGLLLVFAGLWLPGSGARAGFVAMDTQAEVELRDGQVVLRVTTTNRGDEPAFQVRLEALHPEEPKSSATSERLDVGASAEHTFQWDAPGAGYRQRVIPVLTHYTDANYYALSALSVVRSPAWSSSSSNSSTKRSRGSKSWEPTDELGTESGIRRAGRASPCRVRSSHLDSRHAQPRTWPLRGAATPQRLSRCRDVRRRRVAAHPDR